MTPRTLAAVAWEVVGEQLMQARLRGIEFGFVVEDGPRFLPAGTVRAVAQAQADLAGAQLLSLDSEDGLGQLATALAKDILQSKSAEMGPLLAGKGAKA